MGNILVDTQLVVNYYKEENKGMTPEEMNITGSTVGLFQKIIAHRDIIFVDFAGVDDNGKEKDGKILSEWKKHIPNVAKYWFDQWYATLLGSGQIKFISMSNCQNLLQTLYSRYNFPQDGWDKWYVRTAKSVVSAGINGDGGFPVVIITEDLDFYDPNQKNRLRGNARLDFMRQQQGTIPPVLANDGIGVMCVCLY
ncbi:MAG: hypothetical protein AB1531_00915 [Chloroflexota bacterium]